MKNKIDLSLYLVTDSSFLAGRDLCLVVEEAVKGGVTLVQLREKKASTLDFYQTAIRLKHLLEHYNVPLIINDRLDIALAVDADGLHIGQNDIPYEVARKILGQDKIIGLSVESLEDTLKANELDIDYIGISPVFSTPTKTDTAKALGLTGATEINSLCKHPSVGIGGIHLDNVTEVIKTGSEGVSVVSEIMAATDPRLASKKLIQRIIHAKRQKNETI